MTFQVYGNCLILANGQKVSFDLPIRCAIEVLGIVVVALDVPLHHTMTENVFGVSGKGEIVWQIDHIPETATPACKYMDLAEGLPDALLRQLEQFSEYKGVSQYGSGTFVAGNWCGTEAIVDVRTGKVLRTFFLK